VLRGLKDYVPDRNIDIYKFIEAIRERNILLGVRDENYKFSDSFVWMFMKALEGVGVRIRSIRLDFGTDLDTDRDQGVI